MVLIKSCPLYIIYSVHVYMYCTCVVYVNVHVDAGMYMLVRECTCITCTNMCLYISHVVHVINVIVMFRITVILLIV